MGGSTQTSYPGPTPEEQKLQKMQLDSLEQQQQDITDFKPFALQQYGLQENSSYDQSKVDQFKSNIDIWKNNPDPTGTGRSYSDQERQQNSQYWQDQLDQYNKQTPRYTYTPEQQARNQQLQAAQDEALKLQGLQSARQEKALNGELPLSQQLIQQRDLDFSALKEDQAKNGNEIVGDNFDNAVAKTTSGNQALTALRKTYGLLANQEQNAAIQNANLPGVYASQYQISSANANPGAPSNMYTSLTPGYTAAYQPYMAQAQGQFAANSANAANNQSFQNTLLTGLLNGAGRAAAAYAGGA